MDAAGRIIGMIGVIIILIAGLGMTPTVVDQVQNLNTTGWTFTGYEGAIALIGLVPFVWVAAILIVTIVGMFLLAKSGKK